MGTELLESLASVEAAFADLAKRVEDEAWQLPETDVLEVTKRIAALNSKAQGVQVRMVRELETRGVPGSVGATSLRNFLAGALRLSAGEAGKYARLSKALHETCPDTGAALASGGINFEQATRITSMVAGLPLKATPADRVWAEGFLLGHAAILNADDLAKLSKRLDAAIDPAGTLPREKLAHERRAGNIRNNHDGTQTLTWRDTDEQIAGLKAAMFSVAGPAPAADGTRDERTPEQRRADALGEIVRQAVGHGALPCSRGERPKLVVWASAATLATGQGFGRTATGEDLPAETIRRIACDAHHVIHWLDGGPTDLDNLALACGHHHDQIHHRGWEIWIGDDRRPWLRPPSWIDPERPAVRNTYWDTQQATRERLDHPSR